MAEIQRVEDSVGLARYCCVGNGNVELPIVGKLVLYFVDHEKAVGLPLPLGIKRLLRGSGYAADHKKVVDVAVSGRYAGEGFAVRDGKRGLCKSIWHCFVF